MQWARTGEWVPEVDGESCKQCGLCMQVCPNEPRFLVDRAESTSKIGSKYGVPEEAVAYFAHDASPQGRVGSASGGAVTAILQSLLEDGTIDGVIGPKRVAAKVGDPHALCTIHEDSVSLNEARSSHYHPLNYADVLQALGDGRKNRIALLGTPCIIRAVARLPRRYRDKIAFQFCLICSHNVSGRFTDFLAQREGIDPNRAFSCNLRHKNSSMENAATFFNRFDQGERSFCRDRYQNDFTGTWRNHFFAIEACLYCPDFYGTEASMSIKDPWGVRSDPAGWSLLLVRDPALASTIEQCAANGKIVLDRCSLEEFKRSQRQTAQYKSIEAAGRQMINPLLRSIKQKSLKFHMKSLLKAHIKIVREGLRYKYLIDRSNAEYERMGVDLPVEKLIAKSVKKFERPGPAARVLLPIVTRLRSLSCLLRKRTDG